MIFLWLSRAYSYAEAQTSNHDAGTVWTVKTLILVLSVIGVWWCMMGIYTVYMGITVWCLQWSRYSKYSKIMLIILSPMFLHFGSQFVLHQPAQCVSEASELEVELDSADLGSCQLLLAGSPRCLSASSCRQAALRRLQGFWGDVGPPCRGIWWRV